VEKVGKRKRKAEKSGKGWKLVREQMEKSRKIRENGGKLKRKWEPFLKVEKTGRKVGRMEMLQQ
jgi:hypothetical protein